MIADHSILCSSIAVLSLATISSAGLVTEFNNDQAGWNAAVSSQFTTLDFTGFPPGDSPIFDQYAGLGVLFPDGSDFVYAGVPSVLFPLDGCGIFGGDPSGVITMVFDVPQRWIAAHFPGDMLFKLYVGDELIYQSSLFGGGSSNFAGIVSLMPFDKVELTQSFNFINADNIYFGSAIPAAPSIALLVTFLLPIPNGRNRR